MTPIFPSIEDIRAAFGGKITRVGNKVLWSPSSSEAYRIEPTLGGFTPKPFFIREGVEKRTWQIRPNEPV